MTKNGTILIGGGVNANTFNESAKTTLTLTPDSDEGSFPLSAVGFGLVNFDKTTGSPASGYHQQLGYPNNT